MSEPCLSHPQIQYVCSIILHSIFDSKSENNVYQYIKEWCLSVCLFVKLTCPNAYYSLISGRIWMLSIPMDSYDDQMEKIKLFLSKQYFRRRYIFQNAIILAKWKISIAASVCLFVRTNKHTQQDESPNTPERSARATGVSHFASIIAF